LGNHHGGLGIVLSELGQRAKAIAHFRQGLAVHEKLVDDFPAVKSYRGY
jgi:hypothetical protein